MNKHTITVSRFAKESKGTTYRVTLANELATDPHYIVVELDARTQDVYLELDDQIHSSANAAERIELSPNRMLIKIRRDSERTFCGCSDIEVFAADGSFPMNILSDLKDIAAAINERNRGTPP